MIGVNCQREERNLPVIYLTIQRDPDEINKNTYNEQKSKKTFNKQEVKSIKIPLHAENVCGTFFVRIKTYFLDSLMKTLFRSRIKYIFLDSLVKTLFVLESNIFSRFTDENTFQKLTRETSKYVQEYAGNQNICRIELILITR